MAVSCERCELCQVRCQCPDVSVQQMSVTCQVSVSNIKCQGSLPRVNVSFSLSMSTNVFSKRPRVATCHPVWYHSTPRSFLLSHVPGSPSSNRNAVHSFPQQDSSRKIFLLLRGRSSVVFHRYHTRRHDKRTIVVHSSKDASN